MLAVVSVVVILLLAAGVGAVTMLALSGVLADRFPVANARLVELTRHLNGDAEAPERVQRLFQN